MTAGDIYTVAGNAGEPRPAPATAARATATVHFAVPHRGTDPDGDLYITDQPAGSSARSPPPPRPPSPPRPARPAPCTPHRAPRSPSTVSRSPTRPGSPSPSPAAPRSPSTPRPAAPAPRLRYTGAAGTASCPQYAGATLDRQRHQQLHLQPQLRRRDLHLLLGRAPHGRSPTPPATPSPSPTDHRPGGQVPGDPASLPGHGGTVVTTSCETDHRRVRPRPRPRLQRHRPGHLGHRPDGPPLDLRLQRLRHGQRDGLRPARPPTR